MKKKKLFIFLIILISIFIILFFPIYFIFLHHYSGKVIVNNFSISDEFDINNIKYLEKDKEKDFVILNFADIQICDLEDMISWNHIKKELDYLIDSIKPDLITLTGDQTWSNENLISLKRIIRYLDSKKIPYAPVYGNHDLGNDFNKAVCNDIKASTLYENGKYSLFDRGPTNIGNLGNYIINIMEDGNIFKTLIMMNSGYDEEITQGQIDWFKWNMDGLKETYGAYPESILFMHKPLPEYTNAYLDYINGKVDNNGSEVYVYYSLNGSNQVGFFDILKERNVKQVVVGHQHGNVFNLGYDGINLAFALKTGELGGYILDNDIYLNGASYLILNDAITFKNIFASIDKYHFKKPINE